MISSTRGLTRAARTTTTARTTTHRMQWHPLPRRLYSTATDGSDPEWFQTLRSEMLERKLPLLSDVVSLHQETKLEAMLSSFLPAEWDAVLRTPRERHVAGYTGNHLIFLNHEIPHNELLPDGTDVLHSPGGGFVRRMWAGGSVRVKPQAYFEKSKRGWIVGRRLCCAERIKEVRLRGRGDAAKVFVTLERRIASLGRLVGVLGGNMSSKRDHERAHKYFLDQAHEGSGWGDAMLIEERNLVFMRARSDQELKALEAGETKPTKYLDSPGKADFSHTLTPTSSLLFRFSALTFNAHAIHLDREYCRAVEGHRNLLVHGPLTMMLMVKLIASSRTLAPNQGAPRMFAAIEYKNLAPLYCDEPLTLCARERKTLSTSSGSVFDVWIEGPTGGLAVKGTVTTTLQPARESEKVPSKENKNLGLKAKAKPGADSLHTQNSTETSDDVHRNRTTHKNVNDGQIRKPLSMQTGNLERLPMQYQDSPARFRRSVVSSLRPMQHIDDDALGEQEPRGKMLSSHTQGARLMKLTPISLPSMSASTPECDVLSPLAGVPISSSPNSRIPDPSPQSHFRTPDKLEQINGLRKLSRKAYRAARAQALGISTQRSRSSVQEPVSVTPASTQYQSTASSLDPPPRIRFPSINPRVMKSSVSPQNRQIMRVLMRESHPTVSVEPTPYIRGYDAEDKEPWQPESKVATRGIRKIEDKLRISEVGESLERRRWRRRGEGTNVKLVQWKDGHRIRRIL